MATITTDFTPKERNLYAACVAFDTRTFNRLLNTGGIDVNKCGEFGTMLVMASFMGQSISVRKLLATPGIDPNLAFSNGATPLFCAAQFGHNDVVRRLLAERRVNVNLATSENVTPLFIAAAEGHTEAVKLLLSAPDINVNAATQNNETPLYVAADLGFLDIVDLLLDAPKIDLEQRAGGESTPLFIAAQNNHWEIVDRLRRRGAYVNSAIGNGSTPLHIAASNGHGRVVKMLLRAPDIALDQPWMGGATPLTLAAERGHETIVNLLLNKGVSPNSGSATTPCPLHLACFRGHLGTVRSLLQGGADPDAVWVRRAHTHTPSRLAGLGGHPRIRSILAAAPRHGGEKSAGSDAATGNTAIESTKLPMPLPQRPARAWSPTPERAVPSTSTPVRPGVTEMPPSVGAQAHSPGTPALAHPDSATEAPADPEVPPRIATAEPDKSPAVPSPPASNVRSTVPEQVKDALRREVFDKTSKDLIPSEDGIQLLEEIDASTDTDQLCVLHHNMAHAERKLARSVRPARCRASMRIKPVGAPTPAPAGSIRFTLGKTTGMCTEQVEDAIGEYLDQRYRRFVSQAVNNMEFGRGKAAAALPGVLHASAGIPGVGSCCVFYTSDDKRPGEIRILGIGHHLRRTTYRLNYACKELGSSGTTLRIA